MEKKPKVLIMRCDDYDPGKIAGIVKEGMQELGVTPSGKILLKPNVVLAHPEVFPHAFTRKEFLDGVLAATKELAQDVKEISVGERSGITIPTRYNFKHAGYLEVIKKHKVKAYFFDEVRQIPVKIKGKHVLRDQLFIPKPITECDFHILTRCLSVHEILVLCDDFVCGFYRRRWLRDPAVNQIAKQ